MFKPIPEDKCPLDVIAEMGEEVKNARIYLGKNAVKKLRSTADLQHSDGPFERLVWDATDAYPASLIRIIPVCEDFFLVKKIIADDIAFKENPENPERIIFLEMED